MTFENEILKRKYLREGETCWNDLCKRISDIVAEDRPALAERIYDLMSNKRWSPGGSVLANLGTNLSLNNCFTRDTGFITDKGIKYFTDFNHKDKVRVLTTFGSYENAIVHNHGVQPIWEITFRRGKERVKIRCTPDHLWPTEKRGLIPTKELIANKNPKSIKVDKLPVRKKRTEKIKYACPIGIIHGLVFGDGHYNKATGSCSLDLCDDSQELIKFFDPKLYKISHQKDKIRINRLPNYMKEFPNFEKINDEYLYGFFVGWFAADGYISPRGGATLFNASLEIIETIYKQLPRIGIYTGKPRLIRNKSPFDGNLNQKLYGLNISTISLCKTMFLKSNHLQNYNEYISNKQINDKSLYWYVHEVKDLKIKEKVWCLSVENKHTFVLERGIPTHNCYFIPIEEDSIEGIFGCMQNMAKTFSWRGGVGIDISTLRPKGAPVNNAARYSSGSVSFLPLFSDTVLSIGQGSNEKGEIVSRRGACLASIECSHPDVINFIKCKSHPTEVFGEDVFKAIPSDVSGINLSVKITDEFMQAVLFDKEWDLVFKGKVYQTVKAKELFRLIAENAHASGDPGVLFWDRAKKYGTTEFCPEGKVAGVNPCLPSFAPILGQDGITTIGSISEGDKIWTGNEFSKVINKIYRGIKSVYAYKTSAGEVICTVNHKIFQNGVKIKAENAEAIDLCKGFAPASVLHNYEIIMDGLVLGDGGLAGTGSTIIVLHIGEDDQDYFDSEIASLIQEQYDETKKSWKVKTSLTPKDMCHVSERTIPDKYFYGTPSVVASFLRGLFSANGSVILNGEKITRITLKQTSSTLIKQAQIMLNSLGITSYITTNKSKVIEFPNGTYQCKESYDLNISTFESKKLFFEYIGFIQKYKNEKGKLPEAGGRQKTTFDIIEIQYIGDYPVWDITVEDEKHCFWSGGHLIANCGEQILPSYGACSLNSFNLLVYTTKKEFNWYQLAEDVPAVVEFMDWLIDKNHHPLPQQTEVDKYLRKMGIGITGLGDSLALQGIKYSSQAARDFARELMKNITLNAFGHSIKLAQEYGSCPALLPDKNMKAFLNQPFVRRFPKKLKQDIKKYGLRNTAVTSIAPTGSLSIILGNLTSGCEPLFEREYYRTSRVTGETHKIVHPPAIERDIPLENYETASELDWKARVEMQAALQDWTTDSISSTVNLPADTTVKTMEDIYKEAWKAGLKGITVYRDKSKDVQVLNKDTICEERPNTITYYCAPKRPKELPCEIHHSVIRGEGYVSLVGILDDKPYEIFTGKTDLLYIPKSCKTGTIIKKGGGKYNLKIKIRKIETEYRDIANALMDDKEQALTRLISLGMRHGIYPKFIVEQLRKTMGSITDFSTVIARVLSKYAKDLKIIEKCPECLESNLKFESGCISCKDCGWSKCG